MSIRNTDAGVPVSTLDAAAFSEANTFCLSEMTSVTQGNAKKAALNGPPDRSSMELEGETSLELN